MTPSPSKQNARATRAIEETAAARAILSDRRCSPCLAASHLLRGWEALTETEPATLGTRLVPLRAHPPSWCSAASVERVQAALAMLNAASEGATPAGLTPSTLWTLTRDLGLAGEQVQRSLGQGHAFSPRRRPWLWTGAALGGLGLGLLFFLPGAGPTGAPHWQGSFFHNRTLSGEGRAVTEEELVFDWGYAAPRAGFSGDNFSARFATCLTLPKAARLRFSLGSDDGARLFVDGHLVVNNWKAQDIAWGYQEQTLSAGAHALVVEYFEVDGKAKLAFYASTQGPANATVAEEGKLSAKAPSPSKKAATESQLDPSLYTLPAREAVRDAKHTGFCDADTL